VAGKFEREKKNKGGKWVLDKRYGKIFRDWKSQATEGEDALSGPINGGTGKKKKNENHRHRRERPSSANLR